MLSDCAARWQTGNQQPTLSLSDPQTVSTTYRKRDALPDVERSQIPARMLLQIRTRRTP